MSRPSLRHPQVSLADTIAMKLIAFARPDDCSLGYYQKQELHQLAREIVDDLTEYIMDQTIECKEQLDYEDSIRFRLYHRFGHPLREHARMYWVTYGARLRAHFHRC
jgi:hypothetical protein